MEISFYTLLVSTHSLLRWLVLLALVFATFNYLFRWMNKLNYRKLDKTLYLVTLSIFHTQIIIGLVLYFTSPKVVFAAATMSDSLLRFFTLEHGLLMLIAAILITIGSAKVRKLNDPVKKHKRGFWYLLITLLIILAAIPWPFRNFGTNWF